MNIAVYDVINLFNLIFTLIYFKSFIMDDFLVKLLLQWAVEPDQFCWRSKANTQLYWFHSQNSRFIYSKERKIFCYNVSIYCKLHIWIIIDTAICWQLHIWMNIFIVYNKSSKELDCFKFWTMYHIFSSMFPVMILHLYLFLL